MAINLTNTLLISSMNSKLQELSAYSTIHCLSSGQWFMLRCVPEYHTVKYLIESYIDKEMLRRSKLLQQHDWVLAASLNSEILQIFTEVTSSEA